MVSRRKSNSRKRIGNVSYYKHHGAWWIYYRNGQKPVRKRVADTEEAAVQIAAQVNAQLATSAPTLFSFVVVSVAALRLAFLKYHELVLNSSTATVKHYRAATQHLVNFVTECCPSIDAHAIDAALFLAWLRQQQVSPSSGQRPSLHHGSLSLALLIRW